MHCWVTEAPVFLTSLPLLLPTRWKAIHNTSQLLPKCILAQPGVPTHRMYDEVGDGFVPKTSNNGRTQCWEMRMYSVVR